jgi:hypothetical protein
VSLFVKSSKNWRRYPYQIGELLCGVLTHVVFSR